MSIRDDVDRISAAGGLHSVPQSMPGLPVVRAIFASQSILDLIAGPWATKKEAGAVNALRAWFDWFIDGNRVYVRPDYAERTRALLARLDPPNDEIWEMRSFRPKPSIRILGSFADRDVFIALTWELRFTLGGRDSAEWEAAIRRFMAEWQSRFGSAKPFSGRFPDAYLSNAKLI